MNIKTKALWQEVHVDTQGFHKQNPPLLRLAAATIVGPEIALVQMELRRLNVECVGHGEDEDVPFITLQHTDDDQHVWETHVAFPQMKGHQVWTASVYETTLKLALVKDKTGPKQKWNVYVQGPGNTISDVFGCTVEASTAQDAREQAARTDCKGKTITVVVACKNH